MAFSANAIYQRLVLHYLYALYNLKQRALQFAHILIWRVLITSHINRWMPIIRQLTIKRCL